MSGRPYDDDGGAVESTDAVYLVNEDGVEGPLSPGRILELFMDAFGWEVLGLPEPDEETPR